MAKTLWIHHTREGAAPGAGRWNGGCDGEAIRAYSAAFMIRVGGRAGDLV
jgi:hypothetical protein